MSKASEDAKEQLSKRSSQPAIRAEDMLSTGSTLLNVACSGRGVGGFIKGKYYFLVGDSTSGKTWLALTCGAEAANNPEFSKYDVIYDNVEDGALMDLSHYFGSKFAERVRAPAYAEDDAPIYSSTVESFYYHLDNAVQRAKKRNRPFIYVLDSQDALTSSAADDKFHEQKDAYEKGKDAAGSYGDGKAKVHSENIRRALIGIRDTESILIVIGQTRDNLGMGMEKKTRSGGRSLRFYATLEIWTSVKEKIRKTVRGEPKTIGVIVEAKIKKNRITGKDRTVQIPIYHSFGIDDVGSCVDFLIDNLHWKPVKKKGEDSKSYDARELDFEGTREAIIRHVEENNLEPELRATVEDVWIEIEKACAIERKPRYA